MLIAGAKNHAKEILEIFIKNGCKNDLIFFDDISNDLSSLLFDRFKIIKSLGEVRSHFDNSPEFVLGVGGGKIRKLIAEKLQEQGGKLVSIISSTAFIGNFNVRLEKGLNVMHAAMISNNVSIGVGTLINAFASIHHDVVVGVFCEISPHVALLGGCKIGDNTSIGANATVLPNIKVGENVIIGAGSVVNRDIPDNCIAYGVPAIIKNSNVNR